MSTPPQIEQQRLISRLESAGKHAIDVNRRAVEVSSEIGRQKTLYFEKLAIGSGATIALLVSFVGAHAGQLQPAWLLRSSLIVLALAMICAMYRNWKFPFYLMANYARQDQQAKLEREECRRDYIVAFPAIALEDGKPVDVQAFLKNFAEDHAVLTGNIKKSKEQESGAFNIVKYVEWLTLFLIVAGISLLVALAWMNF